MPNWCENFLIIHGTAEELDAFAKKAVGPERQYVSGAHESRDPVELTSSPSPLNMLNFHNFVPVPERLLHRTYSGRDEERAGEMKHGWHDPDHNGYDWEVANWGCKWGANVVQVSRPRSELLVYDFDTPWGPPEPFVYQVSQMFPSLTFVLQYYESNTGLVGFFTMNNGEAVSVPKQTVNAYAQDNMVSVDGLCQAEHRLAFGRDDEYAYVLEGDSNRMTFDRLPRALRSGDELYLLRCMDNKCAEQDDQETFYGWYVRV